METVKMKCTNNLVVYFVSRHFSKTYDEQEEMKQHIINCEKCFKELNKLEPKYDPRIEE